MWERDLANAESVGADGFSLLLLLYRALRGSCGSRGFLEDRMLDIITGRAPPPARAESDHLPIDDSPSHCVKPVHCVLFRHCGVSIQQQHHRRRRGAGAGRGRDHAPVVEHAWAGTQQHRGGAVPTFILICWGESLLTVSFVLCYTTARQANRPHPSASCCSTDVTPSEPDASSVVPVC